MAAEKLYTQGISDIVETEGNLPRFTKICQELHKRKIYRLNEIKSIIKDVAGFRHTSPIKRHIDVFKKIGILDQRDDMYMLSSEGKALLELVKDETLKKELTLPEKIFYFKAFFNNALYQLYILLKTICQKKNLTDHKEVIVDYFRNIINSPFRVWQRESLRRDIEIYESRGQLQSGIQNKFGCMKAWLRNLELLEEKDLILSSFGKEVLNDIESNGTDLSNRTYGMTNIYINGKVNSLPHFNYLDNKHMLSAIELFNQAYSLFERYELRMSDAKSIKYFICTETLMKNQITMEESDFDRFLHYLQRNNIIRSIMADDAGKIAYISK